MIGAIEAASSPMRRRLLGAALVAPLLSCAAPPRPTDADGTRLAAVIAGPQRSAVNRARDGARHPFETLRFFGLEPWHSVVEIAPGGGWYTEILAPYLREDGRLYAAHEAADSPQESARRSRARFAEKLAGNRAVYGRVVLGTMPGAKGFTDIAPEGGADMVLTFRNVHNWIETAQLDTMLQAFHAVLKRGGVLGVEEHRAIPGTDLAQTIRSGYVTEALLIAQAQVAGFELVASSQVNSNARDTKDYADGVWALPPTLRGGERDRARFLAIGESDRMTLKFVKVG